MFAQAGLPALVPKRPGPKGAHKLTEQVMAFVEGVRQKDPTVTAAALSQRVRARFGLAPRLDPGGNIFGAVVIAIEHDEDRGAIRLGRLWFLTTEYPGRSRLPAEVGMYRLAPECRPGAPPDRPRIPGRGD